MGKGREKRKRREKKREREEIQKVVELPGLRANAHALVPFAEALLRAAQAKRQAS